MVPTPAVDRDITTSPLYRHNDDQYETDFQQVLGPAILDLSVQFNLKISYLKREAIIDKLNFQVVELGSRILAQPPSAPDPRTLTLNPNKNKRYTYTLEI